MIAAESIRFGYGDQLVLDDLRLVARPGTPAYGRLSVLAQLRADVRVETLLPARAFTPPPKVESAVVVVHPLPAEKRFDDLDALETPDGATVMLDATDVDAAAATQRDA